MKKIVCLLVSAVFAFVLIACVDQTENTSQTASFEEVSVFVTDEVSSPASVSENVTVSEQPSVSTPDASEEQSEAGRHHESEASQNTSQEVSKEESKEVSEEVSKEESKEESKEVSKEESKEVSKEESKDVSKEESKEVSKEESKEESKPSVRENLDIFKESEGIWEKSDHNGSSISIVRKNGKTYVSGGANNTWPSACVWFGSAVSLRKGDYLLYDLSFDEGALSIRLNGQDGVTDSLQALFKGADISQGSGDLLPGSYSGKISYETLKNVYGEIDGEVLIERMEIFAVNGAVITFNEFAIIVNDDTEVSGEVSTEESKEESKEEQKPQIVPPVYTVDSKSGNASYSTAHGYTFNIDGFNQSVEDVAETTRICTSLNDVGTNWAIHIVLEKVDENVYKAVTDPMFTAGEPMYANIGTNQILFIAHSATSNPSLASQYPNWQDKIALMAAKRGDIFTFSGVDFTNRQTDNASVLVTPADTSSVPDPDVSKDPAPEAVFLANGFVLYDGAAYTQSFYNHTASVAYADVYAQFAKAFPNARVSVVTPPINSIVITNEEINKRISNQGTVLDRMQQTIHSGVSFVNLKNIMKEHADEYLYFKSDHHWTHRGAYYAYYEFAKSVGLTPVDIDFLQTTVVGKDFNGSAAYYSGDDRCLEYKDTVIAYMPTKAHTMRIYRDDGNYAEYSSSIIPGNDYVSFTYGDNKLTVINVPENDQSKSILVIKDSYANAFITYLTEHYGNIVVIDPRHTIINVPQVFKDYGFDDIVFMANTSTLGNINYCNLYKQLLQ